MFDIPLHPAIVHVPLGLAFGVPVAALGIVFAVRRGLLPWRAWLVIVALQTVMLGGGLLAQNAGEKDSEKVEHAIGDEPVHVHEDAAMQFLWSVGIALVLSILVLPSERKGYGKLLMVTAALATLVVAGLGVRAGHAGGQLIYLHGASKVFTDAKRPGAAVAPAAAGEGRAGEKHEGGEKDEAHHNK